MTLNFDKYAQGGHAFVKKVAYELGDENDTAKASRILKATLHVLRDQSSTEESLQFTSQLPMAIKAVYVDGWQPGSHKGRIRHHDDFIAAMHSKHGFKNDEDFYGKEGCIHAVESVLRVLKEQVSEGEIEDICLTLPEDVRTLFDD